MPRSTSEVAFHNFNKGLHTESSPFAFPPDALSVVDNVELKADGTARRRYGVDYEAGYGLLASVASTSEFGSLPTNSYKWDNVDNDPDVTLGLIQVGNKLYVLDISVAAPSAPSAAASLLYTLDMGTASTFASWTGNSKLSFTALEGFLIVTAPTLNNVYRMYWSGSVLTPTAIEVEVRDFWGVDDGLTVAEIPTGALTATHHYNLLNQGWTDDALTTYGTAPSPTNAQVWWLGKDSSDDFKKALLDKQDFGTTPASKGRFIIGVKTRGASRKDAVDPISLILPSDEEQKNFTVVASFSGRAFYAGLDSDVSAGDNKSPNTTAMVFYSRLVSNENDLGKCYQDADPTSEHDSVLVPTDGGFLKLAGAGSIIHMQELAGRLIVFATNGVWEVFGGEGEFAADNYVTRQLSDIPALNEDSILSAEGSLLYWADAGVYAVLPDTSTGRMTVTNIISKTIQSHYKNIPSLGKLYATGFYDSYSKEARWLYGDYTAYNGSFLNRYNKEIVFNVVTQSWTENTFDVSVSTYPFIIGYFETPPIASDLNEEAVLVGGVEVVVGVDPVFITGTKKISSIIERKYITAVLNGGFYDLTLSELNDTSFVDWSTAVTGGVAMDSVMETGEIPFGDVFRHKNTPYIYTHFNRTESGFTNLGGGAVSYLTPSSCNVQARWAFSDSSGSGYYGTAVETYRFNRLYIPSGLGDSFDYGHSIISTKTRVRGRGKSVRFRFSSTAGKDFQLVAWGVPVKAGASI